MTLRRLLGRGINAAGASVAQLAQALTSLVLQVAAARWLGADGLGVFALWYGVLILATAIVAGLVGDSLTVLDRGVPKVRAGLAAVGLASAGLAGVMGGAVAWATGLLSWPSAVVLALGSMVFIVEELLRRLLMATLQFWSVVAVDTTCLVVTIAWLLSAGAMGSVGMNQLLVALVLAQLAGIVAAVRLLPADERWLASWRGADVRAVLHFGRWRAAQQAIRPATLTVTRTLVVVAVGTIAFGQLEAARVYTAPTLLIVNGMGGFLFASYAAERHAPLPAMIRRADVGAVVLFAVAVAIGTVVVALTPSASHFVTKGEFTIDQLAVFGWVLYAATTAIMTPYGGLASVTGRHVRVFWLRSIEAVASCGAIAILMFALDASPSWVPYALALGAAGTGLFLRQVVLARPAPEGDAPAPDRPAVVPGAEGGVAGARLTDRDRAGIDLVQHPRPALHGAAGR